MFDLHQAVYTPPPLPGPLLSPRFWHAHLNHACTRAVSPLAGAHTTDNMTRDQLAIWNQIKRGNEPIPSTHLTIFVPPALGAFILANLKSPKGSKGDPPQLLPVVPSQPTSSSVPTFSPRSPSYLSMEAMTDTSLVRVTIHIPGGNTLISSRVLSVTCPRTMLEIWALSTLRSRFCDLREVSFRVIPVHPAVTWNAPILSLHREKMVLIYEDVVLQLDAVVLLKLHLPLFYGEGAIYCPCRLRLS